MTSLLILHGFLQIVISLQVGNNGWNKLPGLQDACKGNDSGYGFENGNTPGFTAREIYYVTFVKGNVRIAATNKNVALGDKLADADKLIFPDKNARVTCISPTRGRFDLLPDKSSQTNQKEWIAEIKNILVQSSTDRQLSTRDLPDEIAEPDVLFKSGVPGNTVLLIENHPFQITKKYPSDKNNFLFLKYVVDGFTILRKLPVNGRSWYFDSSLFTNNQAELISPGQAGVVSLCYQQMKNGDPVSRVIIKMSPVMIARQEVDNQLVLLRQNLSMMGLEIDQVNNEIYNHFCTNYGYLHPSVFKQLIKD